MRINFALPVGSWSCETSPDSLHISGGSRLTRVVDIPWSQVVQAGICPRRPIQAPPGAPIDAVFPFGGKLQAIALAISETTNYCYIVYCQGNRRRLLTYSVPKRGPLLEQFIAELKKHLGQRWNDELVPLLTMRKRLGFSNWWVAPVSLLIIILVAGIAFAFAAAKSLIPAILAFLIPLILWAWRKWRET